MVPFSVYGNCMGCSCRMIMGLNFGILQSIYSLPFFSLSLFWWDSSFCPFQSYNLISFITFTTISQQSLAIAQPFECDKNIAIFCIFNYLWVVAHKSGKLLRCKNEPRTFTFLFTGGKHHALFVSFFRYATYVQSSK